MKKQTILTIVRYGLLCIHIALGLSLWILTQCLLCESHPICSTAGWYQKQKSSQQTEDAGLFAALITLSQDYSKRVYLIHIAPISPETCFLLANSSLSLALMRFSKTFVRTLETIDRI